MSTFLMSAMTFLGSFAFLFFYWKRLREDYLPNQIFSSGILVIISIFVSSILFRSSLFWFWLTLLMMGGSFLFGFVKYKMRFFESLEACGVGLLIWVEFFLLGHATYYASFLSLAGALFVVVLFFIYYYLNLRYRRFVWYKSGRVGFAGLCVLALFFIARAVVATLNVPMLSFVGRVDIVFSSIVAFILFFAIYNLARK